MDSHILPKADLARRFLLGRRALELALRGLVAAVILAFMLRWLDLGKALAITTGANLRWLLASLALALVVRVLPALAWQTLISAQGMEVSIWQLIVFHYVGLFFNNFTPSNIGGDVARAYLLSQKTGRVIDASMSIVALKLLSVASLLLLAVVATPCAMNLVGGSVVSGLSLGLAFLVFTLILIGSLAAGQKLLGRQEGWQGRMGNWLHRGLDSLVSYRNSLGSLLRAFLWVLLSQVVTIGIPYLIGLALSLQVPPLHFLAFMPIIRLVSMSPISPGGLGMREGAFVILFTQVGLSQEAAFSLSLLNFVVITLASVLGGGLYLFGTTRLCRGSQASSR